MAVDGLFMHAAWSRFFRRDLRPFELHQLWELLRSLGFGVPPNSFAFHLSCAGKAQSQSQGTVKLHRVFLSSSKEKPTLGGTRIKTRKRNIVAPLDPATFADAVVQIYLDNAGDLELVAKNVESLDLNLSRYGYTFFEVVIGLTF
ncbi:hypothetical protein V6N11_065076 [Hibiscus sabdariffa]|uniref:5MP1/2-like HEAT domain-containing protein n=1 Tax=Hibiscus sabdariffa TaxID=183260 RepID=A0ABR2SIX0_9ROSI